MVSTSSLNGSMSLGSGVIDLSNLKDVAAEVDLNIRTYPSPARPPVRWRQTHLMLWLSSSVLRRGAGIEHNAAQDVGRFCDQHLCVAPVCCCRPVSVELSRLRWPRRVCRRCRGSPKSFVERIFFLDGCSLSMFSANRQQSATNSWLSSSPAGGVDQHHPSLRPPLRREFVAVILSWFAS